MQSKEKSTMSTGRGGAGNMAKPAQASATAPQADLSTPVIKQDIYTTGRGGSGNMATNLKDLPEMARAAQDVGVPMRQTTPTDGGYYSTGRGGGGNVVRSGSGGQSAADTDARDRVREEARRGGQRRGSGGIVDKGREMLDKILGKGSDERESERQQGGSAVA